jgi:hypothetical protein
VTKSDGSNFTFCEVARRLHEPRMREVLLAFSFTKQPIVICAYFQAEVQPFSDTSQTGLASVISRVLMFIDQWALSEWQLT